MFLKFHYLAIVGALLSCAFLSGCDGKATSNTGKIAVSAIVPPIAFAAAAVGKEKVAVHTAIPEGKNPHDYSPSVKEVKMLQNARIFLGVGLSSENAFRRALAGRTEIVDVGAGIDKLPFSDMHDDAEEGGHDHGDEGYDTHIWTSTDNLKVIARNICTALSGLDEENRSFYEANLESFEMEMDGLKQRLTEILSGLDTKRFFIYHPSLGYFAREFCLEQIPVELGGKSPSLRELGIVIRKAREEKIKVIFVQEAFNPTAQKALADAVGCTVCAIDPMGYDVPSLLVEIASAMAGKDER